MERPGIDWEELDRDSPVGAGSLCQERSSEEKEIPKKGPLHQIGNWFNKTVDAVSAIFKKAVEPIAGYFLKVALFRGAAMKDPLSLGGISYWKGPCQSLDEIAKYYRSCFFF